MSYKHFHDYYKFSFPLPKLVLLWYFLLYVNRNRIHFKRKNQLCIDIEYSYTDYGTHKCLNFAFKSQIQFFRLNNEEMRNFFYKYNSIYITFAFLLNLGKCNLNSFCYYKFSVHKRTQFKIYISHYEFNSCFEIGYSHMLYVFNLEWNCNLDKRIYSHFGIM